MNSHLVTVEVGVESRTNKRMQLNSLTFDKFRLECLYTKPVQRRCAVHQNRMPFQYICQDVPNNRILTVNYFLSRFNSLNDSSFNKLPDDKGFVKLCCHFLRKAGFMKLKFRTNNNNRTCRIINTFSKKVLTETSLFSL